LNPGNVTQSAHALRLLGAILCAAASVAVWLLFFIVYWPYRGKFNDEGRFVDLSTMLVHHEQSGLLAVPAVALAALGLILARGWLRGRSRDDASSGLQR